MPDATSALLLGCSRLIGQDDTIHLPRRLLRLLLPLLLCLDHAHPVFEGRLLLGDFGASEAGGLGDEVAATGLPGQRGGGDVLDGGF